MDAHGICVSVVSHGQGALIDRFLADLAALAASAVRQVIVTVNLPGDPWQPVGSVLAMLAVRLESPAAAETTNSASRVGHRLRRTRVDELPQPLKSRLNE